MGNFVIIFDHLWLLLIIITVGCVCRRRLFSSSSWLVDFVIVFDACLHLHRRLAFVTTDWYPRLHGWLIMSPLLGIFIFFTSCIVCHRLIISLLWLHNFISGRLHIHCCLTWLLPIGFFASTAMQLHHFWLVSLSSLLPIFLLSLVGNITSILVVLSLCQLCQLPSMDNGDYDRRTSYMLRGSWTQAWVLYLQFGLALDTCNMNSWSWVYFIYSKTGLFIIPRKGYQLNTCASWDSIVTSILEYPIRDNHSDQKLFIWATLGLYYPEDLLLGSMLYASSFKGCRRHIFWPRPNMSAAHIFRCGLSRSFRDLGTFCLGQSARDQVPNTLKSFYTAVTRLFRSRYNAS